eukprot:6484864-Amphidinium_carterae.1
MAEGRSSSSENCEMGSVRSPRGPVNTVERATGLGFTRRARGVTVWFRGRAGAKSFIHSSLEQHP